MSKIPLSPSQLAAIEHFRPNNFIGIAWHKPGEGKTRIALVCAIQSKATSILIIAPKKAKASWEEEIKKLAIDLVMPYEIHSADSIGKIKTYRDFSSTFLIVDELYYFANCNSARSKALKKISKFFPHRIGLSGTIQPAGDNMTIWGQLSAMNLSHIVARNATDFREQYKEKVFNPFAQSKAEFKDKPGALDSIVKKVSKYVHTHFPDNEHRNIKEATINVGLSTEQLKAIEEVKTFFRATLRDSDEKLDYKTAMEVMFSVCKIANGWINCKGSDEIAQTYESNKLERLLEILETLHAAGKQAVIWCMFRNDIAFLQERLPYKTLRFIGGENFNESSWKSGRYPFVLATAASGASVNYFGNVEYAIYYSLPLKLTDFIQSKARHERKNSSHSGAYYYYLLAGDPAFDVKILERLNTNNELEKTLIISLINELLQ